MNNQTWETEEIKNLFSINKVFQIHLKCLKPKINADIHSLEECQSKLHLKEVKGYYWSIPASSFSPKIQNWTGDTAMGQEGPQGGVACSGKSSISASPRQWGTHAATVVYHCQDKTVIINGFVWVTVLYLGWGKYFWTWYIPENLPCKSHGITMVILSICSNYAYISSLGI